ncbi:MAG: DoxX family protein [Muribaculaceae bacterium]|nr:DoxX family protein [Muribaculaceae bacterium]
MILPARHKYLNLSVWLLRIAVGLVFVISGGAKMIDPYGFIYKIGQYLAVWDVTFATDGLILLAAVGISIYEFLAGFALMTGSYKRTSPAVLLILMAFMLPLSIYIAIADPVDDCGCFGDLWIISNTATCLKNFAITAALAYLAFYNRKVQGIFMPSVQWMQMTSAFAYICIVGMIGYHEQPLLDFRPYKIGTTLTGTDETDMKFIYEKNGQWKEFSLDTLPDSTWTFVTRAETPASDGQKAFVIMDGDGDDITEDVISESGEQLLLLIPGIKESLDISGSYTINELNRYISERGGDMIAVVHADSLGRENWIDLSMADYPVYYGEDTAIKSVARGRMAMVYLIDGHIIWKRTVSSINLDKLSSEKMTDNPLKIFETNGTDRFIRLSAIFMLIELAIMIFGFGAVKTHKIIHRRKRRLTDR